MDLLSPEARGLRRRDSRQKNVKDTRTELVLERDGVG